jgi:hypothetical protein
VDEGLIDPQSDQTVLDIEPAGGMTHVAQFRGAASIQRTRRAC